MWWSEEVRYPCYDGTLGHQSVEEVLRLLASPLKAFVFEEKIPIHVTAKVTLILLRVIVAVRTPSPGCNLAE